MPEIIDLDRIPDNGARQLVRDAVLEVSELALAVPQGESADAVKARIDKFSQDAGDFLELRGLAQQPQHTLVAAMVATGRRLI